MNDYGQDGEKLIQEIRDTIKKQHELFDELVTAIREVTGGTK